MTRSVFDVAARLFRVSGDSTMYSVTLQKLMYFSFGWYGRLTGQKLFSQHFYAMEHGPVVGELLALHKGQTTVERDLIEQGREIICDPVMEADSYLDTLLKAVWDYYGFLDRWQLVELTHQEAPWQIAWYAKPEGSKRADLPSEELIDFYLKRIDVPEQLLRALPDPAITFIPAKDLEWIDSQSEASATKAREQFRKAGLICA